MVDGGVQINGGSSSNYSSFDIGVYINGTQGVDGCVRRVLVQNNAGYSSAERQFNMSCYATTSLGNTTLAAGTYTITVRGSLNSGISGYIGNSSGVNQCSMKIFVIQ